MRDTESNRQMQTVIVLTNSEKETKWDSCDGQTQTDSDRHSKGNRAARHRDITYSGVDCIGLTIQRDDVSTWQDGTKASKWSVCPGLMEKAQDPTGLWWYRRRLRRLSMHVHTVQLEVWEGWAATRFEGSIPFVTPAQQEEKADF